MINYVSQPNSESMESLVQLLRVLSDPTRLRLLEALRDGEKNVSGLCQTLELAQPTVSHHLALLRSAGMVRPRRDGKQIFYSLQTETVASADGSMAFTADGHELRVRPNDRANGLARSAQNEVVGSTVAAELTRQSA